MRSPSEETGMPTRKRLFVSFDYDNDETLKTFLIGQSKHDDTPFDVADASVKEHLIGDWQDKVRGRISRADVVCAFSLGRVSKTTYPDG